MIQRPMMFLAAAWLAGMMLALSRLPHVRSFAIILYFIFLFIFLVWSYKQPKWLDSYVKSTRYPQMTLLFLLVPCLLFCGYLHMERELLTQQEKAAPWHTLADKGEEKLLVRGRILEKRLEDRMILELEQCLLATSQGEAEETAGNCLVYVDADKRWFPEVKIGNRILVYGTFSVFRKASNPGQFDSYSYYAGKDLYAAVNAMRIEVSDGDTDAIGEAMFSLRQKLRESLLTLYPEEKAGVLSAMLLGDRDLLPEEIKSLYQKNGISHILAISGLHISMLCMGAFRGLRKLGCPLWTAATVTTAFLLFYVGFTGAGTSSLRAGIMYLVLLLGKLLRRSYDLLSSLSLAAIIVTALRPTELTSAGFLLSFGAVLGVAAGTAVTEDIKGMGRQLLPGLLIQCMTTPISLWFYYELSPYSVFLNLLILPFVSLILGGGICSMLLGLISPVLGHGAAGGVYVLLELYEYLASLAGSLPFSFVLVGRPEAWQMFIYYLLFLCGIAAFYAFGKRCRWLLSCLAVGLCILLFPKHPQSQVAFLDVSQGDCALIVTESGTVILSDCGSSDVSNVGKYRLAPTLKQNGISVIDFAVVSHMDSDHISGIEEILDAMPVWKGEFDRLAFYQGELAIRTLVLPKVKEQSEAYLSLVNKAKQKNVSLRFVEAGDEIYREDAFLLECLAPVNAGKSENDTSLVCLLQSENLIVWFMGDAGIIPEQELLVRLQASSIDAAGLKDLYAERLVVLKVGHHGSKTSSGEAFISFVKPDVSVISCGYRNRYGHPHAAVLEKLEEAGSIVQRTDLDGAVIIPLRE